MNINYKVAFLLPFQFFMVFDQASEFPLSSSFPDSKPERKIDKVRTANLVYRSTDGGQTWQDISQGLPAPVKDDNGPITSFFADENGLYLAAEKALYHSKPNSKDPYWKKDNIPGEHASISPAKNGVYGYNHWGGFSEKINGTSVWSSKFSNFQEKRVRTVCTVFEWAKGAIFIGTDKGLFKSTNSGKTWNHVYVVGVVTKLVESNGILLATSLKGIIRSTDDGETWTLVNGDGGVGNALEKIKGGFAAITYSDASKTRRVRTSYDGGKTWQSIDAGLPGEFSITSIIQVGDNFFCGHPAGIFKSSDKGKTWKLIRPSINGKVFYLSVSGSVMYAIPLVDGC